MGVVSLIERKNVDFQTEGDSPAGVGAELTPDRRFHFAPAFSKIRLAFDFKIRYTCLTQSSDPFWGV